MSILVAGGAGYIGSHMVARLIEQGQSVVVVDNLSTGHKDAIDSKAKFYEGDVRDHKFLDGVFTAEPIEAVVHFAAFSVVPESMEKPLKYFDNNTGGMITLLEVMRDHNVKRIVFSSTAATYGIPTSIPIKETDPQIPINPYGESKLLMEKKLCIGLMWPMASSLWHFVTLMSLVPSQTVQLVKIMDQKLIWYQ